MVIFTESLAGKTKLDGIMEISALAVVIETESALLPCSAFC